MVNQNLYFRLIFVPIVIILLTIVSITSYNITELERLKQQSIETMTENYIEQNKKIVYDKVHQTILDIDYQREENLKLLKTDIKEKVDFLIGTLNHNYEYNKNKKSTKELKSELLNLIKSQNIKGSNNYIFVHDIKSETVLVHNIKEFVGESLKDKKDINGIATFQSKVDILKTQNSAYQKLFFEKPNEPNKQFEKIVYFEKFEPFNWIVGTGKYLDENDKKIKKNIVKKLNAIQINSKNYLFISRIDNFDGGDEFSTMLVTPNKREIIGKKISDNEQDIKGKQYRKEYLEAIKKDNEAYVEYWYKKLDSNEIGKKLSYFYLYKPWNWVISAGFYFEYLEKEIAVNEKIIAQNIERKFENVIYVSLISLTVSILLFFTFAKNITNQLRKHINQIAEQKTTFSSLFENTTDGILLFKEGAFYKCNSAIVDMFQFSSKEECIDKTFGDLSPVKQYDNKDSLVLSEKNIFKCMDKGSSHFEWSFFKKDGEKFYTDVTMSKIILDDGDIIHVLVKDISKRKKLEVESLQKDSILIQQSKMASMGEMIGNIAHQWRQPLNALGLTVQKIKMYYEEDMLSQEELDKAVDKSKVLINKMSTTIDDFRNFFKIDKIKQKFNIKDAITDSLNLVDASLKNNNILIDIDKIDKDIDILGYKNEFEQVLLNVINNAKDALVENKIQNPKITIESFVKEQYIYIEILDNAGGISNKIIENIFDPYFTTKEQGKGTGIGLYMSKMIIQNNMNGNITVENKLGGASFSIKLNQEKING
jgi:PAS domain S-box-containing protein